MTFQSFVLRHLVIVFSFVLSALVSYIFLVQGDARGIKGNFPSFLFSLFFFSSSFHFFFVCYSTHFQVFSPVFFVNFTSVWFVIKDSQINY